MSKAEERVNEYQGCTDSPYARTEREAYLAGYEQAEQDLALSWEDMNKIDHIIQAVIKETPNYSYTDVKDFFEEVLRRFNEYKNK